MCELSLVLCTWVHAETHRVEGVLKDCVSGCEYLGVTREGVVLHSTRRHSYGCIVRAGHMKGVKLWATHTTQLPEVANLPCEIPLISSRHAKSTLGSNGCGSPA